MFEFFTGNSVCALKAPVCQPAGWVWLVLALACAWLCPAHPTTASQGAKLPLRESFDGTGLGDPWVKVLSPEGSIKVKDGWATFVAPAGGRSHIQRPAGADLISISGKLARWASVYLVWDADNWCGVGKLSPTPFGRF